MFKIKGYEPGANITIINALYHKSVKDPETGKWGKDSIDIVFKDLDTGEKKFVNIVEPQYTYYVANSNVPISHNLFFIEKEKTHPVTCKYRQILHSIAEETGNLEWFYDNMRCGNYRENDKLLTLPNVFNADMNIEDYYRKEFDKTYRNESYEIDKVFFDIEADTKEIDGRFPEPGECTVNAITLIDDSVGHKQVYTLLLDNPNNPLIEEFKKEENISDKIKEFVKEKCGGYKAWIKFGLDKFSYSVIFYDDEIAMIRDFFNAINKIKPELCLAWNIAFDLPYLIERIRTLGYDPAKIICHPDFPVKECWYFIDKRAKVFEERGDYSCISSYTVYLDQLILFASRRKGQKRGKITSYKLDFIGQIIAKVRKLSYVHICSRLCDLPYMNYMIFVLYNIMDTIVQLCIDRKTGDVSYVFNSVLFNSTRYAKIHRQTVYLVNRGIMDFYNYGYIMGNNINKHNPKVKFAGAFTADTTKITSTNKLKINGRPIEIIPNCDDFDYKALYPSILHENNMAPNTMRGKVILPEAVYSEENKFNNPYFDRSVSFIEDLTSGNYMIFCTRYLGLASYEQMFDDIMNYYTNIKNPIRGFARRRDINTGQRYMCRIRVNDGMKRTMCHIIDNSKPREMCRIVERYPRRASV